MNVHRRWKTRQDNLPGPDLEVMASYVRGYILGMQDVQRDHRYLALLPARLRIKHLMKRVKRSEDEARQTAAIILRKIEDAKAK